MAQKRMIDRKISVSEQVANLPLESALIFTWGVPHADDVGVLPRKHKTLKATIVPMWDCTLEQFDAWVEAIVEEGLWKEVEYKGEAFYLILRFHDHQTLKRDRQPQVLMNIGLNKDFKESWKSVEQVLESFGIQVESSGFQLETEEKRREEKRSKSGDKSPTNPEFEKKILEKSEEYRAFVKDLASKDYLSAIKIHNIVVDEFLSHWLERSEGAKKARWEKERAFEYQRRIRTWITNYHKFAKDYKCREGIWHRKGETCYCVKEEVVDTSKPLVPVARTAVKALAGKMGVTHESA